MLSSAKAKLCVREVSLVSPERAQSPTWRAATVTLKSKLLQTASLRHNCAQRSRVTEGYAVRSCSSMSRPL